MALNPVSTSSLWNVTFLVLGVDAKHPWDPQCLAHPQFSARNLIHVSQFPDQTHLTAHGFLPIQLRKCHYSLSADTFNLQTLLLGWVLGSHAVGNQGELISDTLEFVQTTQLVSGRARVQD